jgi:hypothetical protein
MVFEWDFMPFVGENSDHFLKQSPEMHTLFVVLMFFGHHMDGWHILFVVLTIYWPVTCLDLVI